MTIEADPQLLSRGDALAAVVLAGLLAGSADVLAAALINRVSPAVVLKAIASGVVGREAFTGGAGVVASGLALQWAMSIVMAATYATACLRVPGLQGHPVPGGLAFGITVFLVMNFVVVPLSAARSALGPGVGAIASELAAMAAFGLIISFASRATTLLQGGQA